MMKELVILTSRVVLWMMSMVFVALLIMDFHEFKMHGGEWVSELMLIVPAILIAWAVKTGDWYNNGDR